MRNALLKQVQPILILLPETDYKNILMNAFGQSCEQLGVVKQGNILSTVKSIHPCWCRQ